MRKQCRYETYTHMQYELKKKNIESQKDLEEKNK